MEQTPVRKGWWSRNWKWFVPVGCLGVIVAIVVVIAIIATLIFGAIKSNDVYKTALEKASTNRTVISELGQPVEGGWLVSGSISVSGSTGDADLAIPISGPKKSGTIYAVAQKSAGEWKFSRLEVEVEGGTSRINLMDSPP
jgi:cytochrome oxidase complex assembly protein 1